MAAGDRAGQFLETLGRTDLATLSRDEWQRFLETILDAYGEQMRQRVADPAVRFAS